jgi:hypothetical protein
MAGALVFVPGHVGLRDLGVQSQCSEGKDGGGDQELGKDQLA